MRLQRPFKRTPYQNVLPVLQERNIANLRSVDQV